MFKTPGEAPALAPTPKIGDRLTAVERRLTRLERELGLKEELT
jgi:hypothetical protein